MRAICQRPAEENMSSSHFKARLYWGLVVVVAIILASCVGCKGLVGSADSEGKKITVLDPRGHRPEYLAEGRAGFHMMAIFNPDTHPTICRDALVPLRMAPRLDSLDNKTIYLVDVGFAGGKSSSKNCRCGLPKTCPPSKQCCVPRAALRFRTALNSGRRSRKRRMP